MTTNKKLSLIVAKPYDYQPIPDSEVERIIEIVSNELFEVANRFDGPSQIEIFITAKGNA
ncbi:MAG: hypothetical protein KJ571_07180 [Bacteroidetes bacterium]|nr:hypothetical protein [Bacteroidota bacterium]